MDLNEKSGTVTLLRKKPNLIEMDLVYRIVRILNLELDRIILQIPVVTLDITLHQVIYCIVRRIMVICE